MHWLCYGLGGKRWTEIPQHCSGVLRVVRLKVKIKLGLCVLGALRCGQHVIITFTRKSC